MSTDLRAAIARLPVRAPRPRLPARGTTSGCSGRSWTAWKPAGRPASPSPAALAFATARPGRAAGLARPAARGRAVVRRYVHGTGPGRRRPGPGRAHPRPGPPAGSLTCIPARRSPGSWPRPPRSRRRCWRPACGRSSGCWPAPASAAARRSPWTPATWTPRRRLLTVTGKYGRNRLDRAAPVGGRRRSSGLPAVPGQHAADGTAALLIGQAGPPPRTCTMARHDLPVTDRHAAWHPSPAAGPRDCTISATPSRSAPSSTRTARAATSTPASRCWPPISGTSARSTPTGT